MKSRKFNLDQLDRNGILRRHKLAIADCIMAWAKFECQFRAMLTAVEERPLWEGAKDYDRLQMNMGWTKLLQALRNRGAVAEVIAQVRILKKDYAEFARTRHTLAHAGCVGTWTVDQDFLVFAPFSHFKKDELEIILLPLQEIERSTQWAKAAEKMAERILVAAGH